MKPTQLNQLRDIVLAAGNIVTKGFHLPHAVKSKGDGSPLTVTDTQCNTFLKSELMKLLPDAGWLSEESIEDASRLTKKLVWVVDPLDGTKEFIRKIPELAISIGLVENGSVIAGAVLNPITQEGGVALMGSKPIFWGFPVSANRNVNSLSQVCVSLSRTEIDDGSVGPYMGLFGKTVPIGSVAYKLLRVAAGVEDLTFSVQPKSEWDICGGVGLLQAVGKNYERLDQQKLTFNQKSTRIPSGAVAGPKKLVDLVHRALVEKISKAS